MRSISRLTALLIVVMTLRATATAGVRVSPDQAKAATATNESCTLLTKEIATAALGEAVKQSNAAVIPAGASGPGSGAASSCEYTGSGLHTLDLNVMHFDASTAAIYKQLCAKKTKDGLTGLGEVSCWYNTKHEELQVLKGTTFFSLKMHRAGDPTEAIKGAAKKIYDALK